MNFKEFLVLTFILIFVIFTGYIYSQDFQPTQITEEKMYAAYGQCQIQLQLRVEDLNNLLAENKKLKDEIKKLKDEDQKDE